MSVGFAAGIAYILGSRTATNAVLAEAEERLAPAAAKDVINELLSHPDTREEMRGVIKNYTRGERDYEEVVNLPKDTDYYKVVMENVRYVQEQFPPTGFHDGMGNVITPDDKTINHWLESYDEAVISGTSK